MNLAARDELRARLLDNPFYVLELPPDASRAEVERAGQKLLGMLELDLSGARSFTTPFGPAPRDAAKVREAMAELRDPQRRLFHELWVLAQPWSHSATAAGSQDEDRAGFDAARGTMGWR